MTVNPASRGTPRPTGRSPAFRQPVSGWGVQLLGEPDQALGVGLHACSGVVPIVTVPGTPYDGAEFGSSPRVT